MKQEAIPKRIKISRRIEALKSNDASGRKKQEDFSDSDDETDAHPPLEENNPYLMNLEERQEWRQKIREVISMYPDIQEEVDPVEKREKMQKLLKDYPLVLEEDDPDWPEDADGWGFNLGQFFDKITIKNNKKVDDDNDDSDNEIIWQDDNYIRPIKEIRTAEWEETVFKDISPLVIIVHNRYKRFVLHSASLSLDMSAPRQVSSQRLLPNHSPQGKKTKNKKHTHKHTSVLYFILCFFFWPFNFS